MLLDVVHSVLPLVLGLVDEVPEAEDVKAGSIAFVIFIAGFVALGLLGWSLVRHLRKVEDARERGAPRALATARAPAARPPRP